MKVVAIKEQSAGNERVGSMWLTTKIFEPETPLIEVLAWAGSLLYKKDARIAGKYGRLMLTVAEEEEK